VLGLSGRNLRVTGLCESALESFKFPQIHFRTDEVNNNNNNSKISFDSEVNLSVGLKPDFGVCSRLRFKL